MARPNRLEDLQANTRRSGLGLKCVAGEAGDQYDLVLIQGESGRSASFVLADASTSATTSGLIGVLLGKVALGGEADVNMGAHILEGVDTSGYAAAGDPVYLSDTAGKLSVTPGTVSLQVGEVLKKDVSAGMILIYPQVFRTVGGVLDDLRLTAGIDATIASGSVALTQAVHTIRGQGAAADNADTISGLNDAEFGFLVTGAEAITYRDNSVGGGNIYTANGTSLVTATADVVFAFRAGAKVYIEPLVMQGGRPASQVIDDVGFTSQNYVTDGESVPASLDALDVQLGKASKAIFPMAVFGTWGRDVDGANTNGAGLVGVEAVLTEQSATLAKVEDNAVFADLSASGAEAGYTANYQTFPDTPVAGEDFAYFGAAVPFPEVAFDMGTVATHDATGVHGWTYWNGSAWTALTISYDGTEGTAQDGTESFERDGAMSFVPPADWASTTVDGQAGYWIRIGIEAGKAANLTQVGILNSKEHELVTPEDGYVSNFAGTVTGIRASDAAATLHTAADVKFMLVNFTTGAHSGELTWAQDKRTDAWTSLTLAVAVGDELGVVNTAEDGTNEPSNVAFELSVTIS